ncbi:MAG: bifunctional chorismate mutase/prephenate dehydratase [Saccharofermentans sp.]|nr:bifunctional chorismate mutase/prephenate dehydratase [Saccharofermentans sp.]
MTQKESSRRIEEIDHEIAKLVEERLDASRKADEGIPASEIAQKCRRYERGFMNSLEQEYKDISGYERVLFQALFDMSHSYKYTMYGTKTELADRIKEAIEKTPKIFPSSGTIACQGIEGAYSQIATDKIFANANIMYFKTFEGVFQAVESGLCEYGMLPIENSSYGSVTQVYDLMAGHRFHIARDYKLKINHQLLVKPGTDLSAVKEIFSHNQAIGQCSHFLKDNPQIKITVVENTAVAARMVADSERTDVAAISSADCRELYGLSSIPCNIMNTDHNYTRFICITKDLRIYPGASKTSIMMALGHKPGALADTLAKFSSLGLNLTKIESRPIAGSDFEFMFYLDFEASAYSEEVVKLLCQLDAEPSDFAYLGTYI